MFKFRVGTAYLLNKSTGKSGDTSKMYIAGLIDPFRSINMKEFSLCFKQILFVCYIIV